MYVRTYMYLDTCIYVSCVLTDSLGSIHNAALQPLSMSLLCACVTEKLNFELCLITSSNIQKYAENESVHYSDTKSSTQYGSLRCDIPASI